MWRSPKVVTEVSRVPVNGVFKYDIMSSLPYVETVSDETYDVTDVMMDDSRVLLLKVSFLLVLLLVVVFWRDKSKSLVLIGRFSSSVDLPGD
jgi:hypothetical protein